MDMIPVSSSNIAAVGYDASNYVLRVQFNNGRTYEYDDVMPNVYENLIQAASVGQVFNATVKNQYTTREV